jgi:hypothetical protein
VIFHGVLPSVFSDARPVETVKRRLAASIGTRAMNNRVVLMDRKLRPRFVETSQFLVARATGHSGFSKLETVTQHWHHRGLLAQTLDVRCAFSPKPSSNKRQ